MPQSQCIPELQLQVSLFSNIILIDDSNSTLPGIGEILKRKGQRMELFFATPIPDLTDVLRDTFIKLKALPPF